MTDDTHDSARVFSASSLPMLPFPGVESNTKHGLTLWQASKVLALAFPKISLTISSTESDGSGSLGV